MILLKDFTLIVRKCTLTARQHGQKAAPLLLSFLNNRNDPYKRAALRLAHNKMLCQVCTVILVQILLQPHLRCGTHLRLLWCCFALEAGEPERAGRFRVAARPD